ncbi:hypothetical protein [Pseudomonas taeanensis]|nr:hypothetical protein [Pseudomonas taeanensis]
MGALTFFDEIDHEWMLMFLGHRIADRRMLGLICKWLQAGVMEDVFPWKQKTVLFRGCTYWICCHLSAGSTETKFDKAT